MLLSLALSVKGIKYINVPDGFVLSSLVFEIFPPAFTKYEIMANKISDSSCHERGDARNGKIFEENGLKWKLTILHLHLKTDVTNKVI